MDPIGPPVMLHGADHILWALLNREAPKTFVIRDWQYFHGAEPGSPDQAVTIYETQGRPDGRSMLDGEIWEHQGIAIRLRALDSHSGRRAAAVLRNFLSKVCRAVVLLDGSTYMIEALTGIGTIVPMGEDPKSNSRRQFFSINCMIMITVLTNQGNQQPAPVPGMDGYFGKSYFGDYFDSGYFD